MQSPGTWDRDYVLVEHGFEYKAKDGSVISIKPHERYILLKRTNEHWWQVGRDHKSQPFYIPAKYVKVLSSSSWGSREDWSEDVPTYSPCTQYSYSFVAAEPHCPLAAAPSGPHNAQVQRLLANSSSRSLLDLSELRRSQVTVEPDHQLGPLRTFHNSKRFRDPVKRISLMGPLELEPRIRPSQSLNDLQLINPAGSSHQQLINPAGSSHQQLINPAGSSDQQPINPAGSSHQQPINPAGSSVQQPINPAGSSVQQPINPAGSSVQQPINPAGSSVQQPINPAGSSVQQPINPAGSSDQQHINPAGSSSDQQPLKPVKSPGIHLDMEQLTIQLSNVAGNHPRPPPEKPPTPEADYPEYSPDNIDVYPEADYDGHYIPPPPQQVPTNGQFSGWSCQVKDGQKLYINNYSGETWLQSEDQYGKTYFYTPDGSNSQWKLPQLRPSELQSETNNLDQNSNVFSGWQNNFTAISLQKETELQTKGLEKAGVLHKTKMAENGKRLRKNWSSSWTVLEGGILTFFKDTKNLSSNSLKQSLLTVPEHTVRLQGATLSWATKDKSSKKHVMELKTRDGCEYLIHHDSEAITKDWFASISKSIGKNTHVSSDYTSENETESLSEFGSTEKLGLKDEKKNPGQNSDSDRNVRAKLKKFLQRRPTLQSLRDKGYIRDQVFGCHLHQLCEWEKRDVPEFVSQAIEVVERRGLDIDGLYRISGNLAVIQKLRYKVDHGENFSLDDGRWEDVHVITGALKLFFRELPEPLFPYSHYEQFVEAIKFSDQNQKIRRLKELILSLPPPNLETMRLLFSHLCRVIEHKDSNRMSVQSVAIVFGPTLLRPELEGGNIAMNMVYQNQIVEQILLQYKFIFS
ncbi:rho GTPase-activating protein 27 isoform X2 [Dendropsophus ebraccatus]|uniref:rho GTPase-activating protein 27 isoform X2 n=1 Tax=Dendropsophus ebraccatus TaxID=150705 RepID=UPI003831C254